MFLVDMTFIDVEKITPELTQQHRNYLATQYENKKLMFGGRKEPRTGGILLSQHDNEDELRQVLNGDPFIQSSLVTYSITEFHPVMANDDFIQLLA